MGQAGKPGNLWKWAEVRLQPGAGMTSQPGQDGRHHQEERPKACCGQGMGGHPGFLVWSLPWMAVGCRDSWGGSGVTPPGPLPKATELMPSDGTCSDHCPFRKQVTSTDKSLKFLLGLCWAELWAQQTNRLPWGVRPLAGGRPGGADLDLSEFL